MSAAVEAAFAKSQAASRPAFIPYITAGYPRPDVTVPAMLAAEANGADIIELGVPFSDPIADGNTIQAANQRALDNGVRLPDCLRYVKEARAAGLAVPIILMGYYNPFLQFGEEKLINACADAGVQGFIVVDLPPLEALSFRRVCDARDLCLVPLVSPTTTDARLAEMAKTAKGYVYCVSLNGVTGARTELPEHLGAFLGRVRTHIQCPLAVGFGLSTRAHVKGVGQLADGAIMGSAVIKALAQGDTTEASCKSVGEFIHSVCHD